MTSSVRQTFRHLCWTCIVRLTLPSHLSNRSVSTTSAINRGLRASKTGDEPKRGRDEKWPRNGASRGRGAPRTQTDVNESRGSEAYGSRSRRSPSARISRRDKNGSIIERSAEHAQHMKASKRLQTVSRMNESGPHNVSAYDARSTATPNVERSLESTYPEGGLLRNVKSACGLVAAIQSVQSSGGNVRTLADRAKALLSRINAQSATATFREAPSDAVAALLQQKALPGTFARERPDSSSPSIIYQRHDGSLDLFVGTGRPAANSEEPKTSSSIASTQKDTRSAGFDKFGKARDSAIRKSRTEPLDEDGLDDIPVPLPYTTAASEFLYGYNSVLAALKARKRKLYKLYVHPKIFERETATNHNIARNGSPAVKAAQEFVSLAKEANIPFQNEFKTALLDRMSDGRPHNGVILETSRLPAPPVLSLGKPDLRRGNIPLNLGSQSPEDASVNGSPQVVETAKQTWRYPLVVLLDGITDPGNVGNILRTCHFYGVDAVAVATNTCANLSSAVLAKASSGACEAVQLLALPQPSSFVFECSKNKWKIHAAVAPTAGTRSEKKSLSTSVVASDSPLAKHPCILMLGAEGEGLRENLKKRADQYVSIGAGKRAQHVPDVGVDSINVGVSAGVLLEAFLRKPANAPEKQDTSTELGW